MTDKPTSRSATVWRVAVCVFILAVGGAISKMVREAVGPAGGAWSGSIGGAVALGIVIFVICTVFRAGWQKSLALAVIVPICMITAELFRSSLQPVVGTGFPSNALAGTGAALIGVGVGFLLTRWLKIEWAAGPKTSTPPDEMSSTFRSTLAD